jgi:hypothetical protein
MTLYIRLPWETLEQTQTYYTNVINKPGDYSSVSHFYNVYYNEFNTGMYKVYNENWEVIMSSHLNCTPYHWIINNAG